jgi:hypothetical protein
LVQVLVPLALVLVQLAPVSALVLVLAQLVPVLVLAQVLV